MVLHLIIGAQLLLVSCYCPCTPPVNLAPTRITLYDRLQPYSEKVQANKIRLCACQSKLMPSCSNIAHCHCQRKRMLSFEAVNLSFRLAGIIPSASGAIHCKGDLCARLMYELRGVEIQAAKQISRAETTQITFFNPWACLMPVTNLLAPSPLQCASPIVDNLCTFLLLCLLLYTKT